MKKLKIFYDNIIYSLQNVGGISNQWTNLIKGFIKKIKLFFLSQIMKIYLEKLLIIKP